DYVRDGHTTYCWAFNASPSDLALSRDSLFSSGFGAACPLELIIVSNSTSVQVNEWIPLAWTVTMGQAYASSANGTENAVDTASSALSSSNSSSGSSEEPQRFVIAHSAIHLCGQDVDACDPFSTRFRNANLTMTHVTNLSHFSTNDSITFRSNGEVAFSTPGEFTLAAYLVLPGIGANERHDFIAYTTIRVDATPNTSVQVASDNGKPNGLFLGITLAQFIIITAGIVVIFGCAITAIVVITRRRRQQQQQREFEQQQHDAKVSHTAAGSPVTGDSQHFRFSDWSEIYATQDTLPSSILVDDSTTIAILRASRVSSSPASSITERHVADFTRGGGYWDVRPSASPITPLSSMFFAHHSMESINSSCSAILARDERELGSPVDIFVPLETLGRRRTRPCHADALSDSDSDEEEAQEIEF
uniref:Uncharacterized protein n=1 Tax=Globisporangium ultimum (strain ATCC 200006 / CBS 805.95 / DAOM BR144) TaxID=431595 RepID=K3WMU5_GLOUD